MHIRHYYVVGVFENDDLYTHSPISLQNVIYNI